MQTIMENNLEEILILKSKNGDSNAFGLLIKNYKSQLYGYLRKFDEDKSIADDMMQETLIKVWKAFPNYSNQNKFASWLFTIAHNVALDFNKSKKNRSKIFQQNEIEFQTKDKNPCVQLENKELKEVIISCVNSLPEKQKHVFLLRQNGGLSFKEISQITDEPINTVLGHMHYATKKIRKILRDKNVI